MGERWHVVEQDYLAQTCREQVQFDDMPFLNSANSGPIGVIPFTTNRCGAITALQIEPEPIECSSN